MVVSADHVDEVMEIVYTYLHMLRQEPAHEWIFREVRLSLSLSLSMKSDTVAAAAGDLSDAVPLP
jgi:hypothetical protein